MVLLYVHVGLHVWLLVINVVPLSSEQWFQFYSLISLTILKFWERQYGAQAVMFKISWNTIIINFKKLKILTSPSIFKKTTNTCFQLEAGCHNFIIHYQKENFDTNFNLCNYHKTLWYQSKCHFKRTSTDVSIKGDMISICRKENVAGMWQCSRP